MYFIVGDLYILSTEGNGGQEGDDGGGGGAGGAGGCGSGHAYQQLYGKTQAQTSQYNYRFLQLVLQLTQKITASSCVPVLRPR
jgi:hypothetical protein